MKDVTGCLRTNEAAAYVGLSPHTLCNYRTQDRKAMAIGQETRGPRFLLICGGNVCVYRVADLDAWLRASAKAGAKSMRAPGKRVPA